MSHGLDVHYLHPDGRVDPPEVSIQYAVAYGDWFRMMFDFEREAPTLASLWSYRDADAEPSPALKRDVDRLLKQRALCPWGGSMEARIREEISALKKMVEYAAKSSLRIRVSGYARPMDLSLYVRQNDGTLDEPFASEHRSEFSELHQLIDTLGSASQLARIWVHSSTTFSLDETRQLHGELSVGISEPGTAASFLSRLVDVCAAAIERGLGIHAAGGSYGEGLQVILMRGGTAAKEIHPGIDASLSLSIPAVCQLLGKVWDYTDNTVSGEDLRGLRDEIRSVLRTQSLSDAMASDLREAEFLSHLAEKHGLDLLFSGP